MTNEELLRMSSKTHPYTCTCGAIIRTDRCPMCSGDFSEMFDRLAEMLECDNDYGAICAALIHRNRERDRMLRTIGELRGLVSTLQPVIDDISYSAGSNELPQMVDDMAMLLRRCCRKMGDCELTDSVKGYLSRKGCGGSILRTGRTSPD